MPYSADPAWDAQYNLYKTWNSDNVYKEHTGKFVIPLALSEAQRAAGQPSVVIVDAFAPYTERVMTFDVKKASRPPVIPKPTDSGPFVFLGGQIKFDGPTANSRADAFDWTVSGAYVYIQSGTSADTDGYVLTGFPVPLAQQYDSAALGTIPDGGAAAELGADALGGYTVGQTLQPSNGYWSYSCPTFFPAALLNADLAIGAVPPPQN
jgi:hypothetical protein